MNQVAFAAASQAGGEALWRTNPVLCVDRMLALWDRSDSSWAAGPGLLRKLLATLHQQGVRLPSAAIADWATCGHIAPEVGAASASDDPAPRVVGLAVDRDAAVGYVFPLRPAPSDGWRIDPDLPFTPDQVQDSIAGLLAEVGIPDPRAVPERLAFRLENPTGMTARGDSMTIAAVLAILDHLGGHSSPLLRAAVSLVELRPGGRLGGVAAIEVKLKAACRECGPPSLVICYPGTDVILCRGAVVWEVESLADLAGHMRAAGLLAPLLDAAGPLTRHEAARVLDRLRWLVLREHRYRDAIDLGDRARRCDFAAPPDPAVWVEFARLHSTACRNHGRYAEAVAAGQHAYDRVSHLNELACDDEEADAAEVPQVSWTRS